MKNSNKSYPYPVLGIGDDILPKPSFTVAPITADNEFYFVEVSINIDNKDIENLIDEGYAEYGCEVECPRTFFMKWFGYKTKDFTIAIPRNDVAGKVSFNCRISVIKNINNYKNTNFHEDYAGTSFNLIPGNILAFFGEFTYDADIEYNKLHSAGSFLTIIEGTNEQINTTYSIDHQKIEIKLPSDLYKEYKEKYNKRTSKWADIFHSSIAFNALVFALMSYNEQIHKDLLWARTLQYRINLEPGLKQYKDALIQKLPIELIQLAQDLLGNPYKRMFRTISNIDNLIQSSDSEYDTGI